MGAIIAVLSQKGGVGKTTTTVHLAARALELNPSRPLLLVDADPSNAATRWCGEALPELRVERIDSEEAMIDEVPEWLLELDQDADDDQGGLILIDCQGGDNSMMRGALWVADLACIPVGPSSLDYDSAEVTWRAVQRARQVRRTDDHPGIVFLPSRMTRTRVGEEVLEMLEEREEPILRPGLPQRALLADAPGQGALIWNMPGAGELGDQVRGICDQILNSVTPAPLED